MFNLGDRVELVKDTVFGLGVLNKGTQGTFVEYKYGVDIDGEFMEYRTPSCVVELDPIIGKCIVEEYEIRKVEG